MCWGWMEFFLTPSRGLQRTQGGTDWGPWTCRAPRCPGSHICRAQRHLTMAVGSQAAWEPTCEDQVHRAPESLGSAVEIKQALSVVKQQRTFAVCLVIQTSYQIPPCHLPQVSSPVSAQQENPTGQTYLPPNQKLPWGCYVSSVQTHTLRNSTELW